MHGKPSTARDLVAALLVLTALALPFLPFPGDGLARMKVHFRADAREKPQLLSTETSRSVCVVMAAALSYDDPETGAFTRVNCQD
ncbi:MAG TPA: hypothetical protein VE397_09800 [Stellaceae bacterium]|jgi:hypothetical protein|nr:hypothetical protein [Stellaceae bacterium]